MKRLLPQHNPRSKRQRSLSRVIPLIFCSLFPTLVSTQITGLTSEAFAAPIGSVQKVIHNRGEYSYKDGNPTHPIYSNITNLVTLGSLDPLTDPKGQILGCGGQPLANYTGFRVALYDPDGRDATGTELGKLVSLTPTELPDIPGDGVPKGLAPNGTNQNPFALTNENEGTYSFLLDRSRGQLDLGRSYILVVDPPAAANFTQRRIKLKIIGITPIGDRQQVSYQATSLDGMPIGIEGEQQVSQNVVLIDDADNVGLSLLALQFSSALCETSQIQITKSGDRANAAVGDIVIYRLTIRNITDISLDNISVTDTLPIGFKFLEKSLRAELAGKTIPITVEQNARALTFSTPAILPKDGVINLVYAAQLTPDAVRGNGQNIASVEADRTDNDLEVHDGPASHRVRITPGIVSDCGTVIGRVFEDKNFDGQQQKGEPGIPNAAIYMDDGNRITTDENGLFSVKCVLPGHRNGTLDLTTLPGYVMAPNHRFVESNGPGRLVHLAPGSMVRMNFGVAPAFNEQEEVKP